MAKRIRPQTQKDRAANRARYEAMSQLSEQPPRNRSRYSRADFRNRANRGIWED